MCVAVQGDLSTAVDMSGEGQTSSGIGSTDNSPLYLDDAKNKRSAFQITRVVEDPDASRTGHEIEVDEHGQSVFTASSSTPIKNDSLQHQLAVAGINQQLLQNGPPGHQQSSGRFRHTHKYNRDRWAVNDVSPVVDESSETTSRSSISKGTLDNSSNSSSPITPKKEYTSSPAILESDTTVDEREELERTSELDENGTESISQLSEDVAESNSDINDSQHQSVAQESAPATDLPSESEESSKLTAESVTLPHVGTFQDLLGSITKVVGELEQQKDNVKELEEEMRHVLERNRELEAENQQLREKIEELKPV